MYMFVCVCMYVCMYVCVFDVCLSVHRSISVEKKTN